MPIDQQTSRILTGHNNAISQLSGQVQQLVSMFQQLQRRPTTVQEEIDSQPGRRIESFLTGEVTFTANDVGQRATPIVIQVSQDGPFVMTHYPMVLWRPSAPGNATNFQKWRPVSTFPLPTQQVGTDIIDIMYELNDGGAQRFMQNAPRGPAFSRPDNFVPCPLPTVWAPNASIIFQPTYLSLTWNAQVPPTAGILHVDLIGYRITNL